MPETGKALSGERITAAFTALSEFLSQPCCSRCEGLVDRVKRLRGEEMQHLAACPKDLLHAMRRTVPFPASHASAGCGRCLPAEILMRYLTPGEDLYSATTRDHCGCG